MELTQLREQMTAIDDALVSAVLKRMALSEEIGRLKAQQGIPVEDLPREAQLRSRLLAMTKKSAHPQETASCIERIYDILLTESKRRQRNIPVEHDR